MHIQVLNAQYSDKPSHLQSSLFSTVPIILPSQHPTLSPSGLTTEMPIIKLRTTPIRYPTQSPYNKPSWLSFF